MYYSSTDSCCSLLELAEFPEGATLKEILHSFSVSWDYSSTKTEALKKAREYWIEDIRTTIKKFSHKNGSVTIATLLENSQSPAQPERNGHLVRRLVSLWQRWQNGNQPAHRYGRADRL